MHPILEIIWKYVLPTILIWLFWAIVLALLILLWQDGNIWW